MCVNASCLSIEESASNVCECILPIYWGECIKCVWMHLAYLLRRVHQMCVNASCLSIEESASDVCQCILPIYWGECIEFMWMHVAYLLRTVHFLGLCDEPEVRRNTKYYCEYSEGLSRASMHDRLSCTLKIMTLPYKRVRCSQENLFIYLLFIFILFTYLFIYLFIFFVYLIAWGWMYSILYVRAVTMWFGNKTRLFGHKISWIWMLVIVTISIDFILKLFWGFKFSNHESTLFLNL